MAWCTNELDTPCTPKKVRTNVSQVLLASRNDCKPPAAVAAAPSHRLNLVVVRLRLLASRHLRRASFRPRRACSTYLKRFHTRDGLEREPIDARFAGRRVPADDEGELQLLQHVLGAFALRQCPSTCHVSESIQRSLVSIFEAQFEQDCISVARMVALLRSVSPFSSWFAHLRVPLRTPTVRRLVRPFCVSCLLRACLACRVWRVLSAGLPSTHGHAFQLAQPRSKRGMCHLVRCGEGLRCACSKPPAPRPPPKAPSTQENADTCARGDVLRIQGILCGRRAWEGCQRDGHGASERPVPAQALQREEIP